jgi:hypothetical protein
MNVHDEEVCMSEEEQDVQNGGEEDPTSEGSPSRLGDVAKGAAAGAALGAAAGAAGAALTGKGETSASSSDGEDEESEDDSADAESE